MNKFKLYELMNGSVWGNIPIYFNQTIGAGIALYEMKHGSIPIIATTLLSFNAVKTEIAPIFFEPGHKNSIYINDLIKNPYFNNFVKVGLFAGFTYNYGDPDAISSALPESIKEILKYISDKKNIVSSELSERFNEFYPTEKPLILDNKKVNINKDLALKASEITNISDEKLKFFMDKYLTETPKELSDDEKKNLALLKEIKEIKAISENKSIIKIVNKNKDMV